MILRLAYAIPEPAATQPLTFDPDICIACNICIDVCQVDIMVPNLEVGEPPIVLYPGECWYDGSCVSACPEPGAITLNSMASKRVHYRRKTSGEDFFV
jgi:NAD-dependent dihydropyrimidine dehydrogenase PreA subunit